MSSHLLHTIFVLGATLVKSEKQWSIISETSASVLMGVGAGRDDLALCGAANNNEGSFPQRYENGAWSKGSSIPAGLVLDAAGSLFVDI